jgi:hypothetical protein
VSQTERTAQLVKPKSFSALIFIVLLLLCLFPTIVYVALYAAKKDRTVYLEMTDDGTLHVNGRLVGNQDAEPGFPAGAVVVIVLLCIFAAYQVPLMLSEGGGGHLIVIGIALGVALAVWRLNAPD